MSTLMYWRDQVLYQTTDTEKAKYLIAEIAASDAAFSTALTADRNNGRFADDESVTAPISVFRPKDQLVFTWRKATAYSTSLAAGSDRFYHLLPSK